MNIKLELLRNYITDIITSRIEAFAIEAAEVADTTAIRMPAFFMTFRHVMEMNK